MLKVSPEAIWDRSDEKRSVRRIAVYPTAFEKRKKTHCAKRNIRKLDRILHNDDTNDVHHADSMHFNSSHLARDYLSETGNKFVLHSLLHDPTYTTIVGVTTRFFCMCKLVNMDTVDNYAIRASVFVSLSFMSTIFAPFRIFASFFFPLALGQNNSGCENNFLEIITRCVSMLHIITHTCYQASDINAHGIQRNRVCFRSLPDCSNNFDISKANVVDLIERESGTSILLECQMSFQKLLAKEP